MVGDTCGAEADLALAVHASCPLLRHGPAAAPPLAADGDAGTIAACGGAPPPRGCADTCRFAADGECDDGGPGAQYEECAYGTDCADCGPGTEPSERRGYAGVSHALSLAAGEYWLLVSDDGDGGGGGAAEDAMWHVRATCDGGAAPVAGEPCGRWRTCGACVARAACGWCASSASCHAGATSRRTAPLQLHCVCTAVRTAVRTAPPPISPLGLVEGALLSFCARWDPFGETCAAPPTPPLGRAVTHRSAAPATAVGGTAARGVAATAAAVAVGAAVVGVGLVALAAARARSWLQLL